MEQQYLNLMKKVLDYGDERKGRNAIIKSIFGETLSCDMADGFPLITTKKMFWRGIVEELAWFLRGSTNVEELRDKKVHIWDKNSKNRNYDAGPVYGFQWRHYGAEYKNCNSDYTGKGIDQIGETIRLIKEDKYSRRLMLSAWNPAQQSKMCLPPCHVSYQFYVEKDNRLSVQMYQRSSDVFLGLPFNIASTALLLHLIAHQVNLKPGRLLIQLGDVHIYQEHYKSCEEQLKQTAQNLPEIIINRSNTDLLWNVQKSDITLVNYVSSKRIKAQMIA
jgi:thymidylate synthase